MKKLTLSVETGSKPVDPLQIFEKLTLRGSIENIWEPQADALRQWHEKRRASNVAIEMNTGGGKTLVGLLIAQSLVNEEKGRVLYVCSNNQLIEQTHERAKEIGLTPARRYKTNWHDRNDFDAGSTFCLTNYASVFNGKSVFLNDSIDALVFDDAHVAENNIRGQFTLKIPANGGVFRKILDLCREHFVNSDRFIDVMENRHPSIMFIPMFIVSRHASQFRRILLDNGIEHDLDNLFAWEHLKDHLNHCCFITDGNSLQITPAALPLAHLGYFQETVRRIYLTATLPSRASFARTFGISEPEVIRPSGKSGDAQRLFVFVPGEDIDSQRGKAKNLVERRKACVISPSKNSGQDWVPPATIYDTQGGQQEIDRFAASENAELLCLVARYDGIDLPGDACRILILAGLPTGESLIDRFIDETIQVEAIRTSHTATRIVQAIGRIFRSNTDHGVVVLAGPKLQSWVRIPKNRVHLPELLQKQLGLGIELESRIRHGEATWEELIDALLSGDRGWDDTYNEYIERFDTDTNAPSSEWHVELILDEKRASELLWSRQFRQAASLYSKIHERAKSHDDPKLAAWYRHWNGLALLCANEKQEAFQAFIDAANSLAELGRPLMHSHAALNQKKIPIGTQEEKLADMYRRKKRRIFDTIDQVETHLVYGPETRKAEEALDRLGWLLGLCTRRPDNSNNKTGPDVTWQLEGASHLWGFELKTNKNRGNEYSKKEISQCHDHKQWLLDKYKNAKYRLTIVGPLTVVSNKANPFPELLVTEIDAFSDILKRCRQMFEAIESGEKDDLEVAFQSWLDYYGLRWPNCVESMNNRLAVDLREE